MCSSARPWRFRSTGNRSGRQVRRKQITLPLYSLFPMNCAIWANTRLPTPLSPELEPVSELSVGFVHDNRDRTHSLEEGQDPLQISFRRSLPHTAKIL